MVDPQARVSLKSLPSIVPESVYSLLGIPKSQAVPPGASDESLQYFPGLWIDQCVLIPGPRWIDIDIAGRDIEITGQNDREPAFP